MGLTSRKVFFRNAVTDEGVDSGSMRQYLMCFKHCCMDEEYGNNVDVSILSPFPFHIPWSGALFRLLRISSFNL